MLVLTIDHAVGFRIEAILGDVVGATVRPDNPYIEGVKSLDGGAVPRSDEVVRTRQDAVADLVDRARQMGANAVVGLRFDHRNIAGQWSEICAYGTAVWVEPRSDHAVQQHTALASGEQFPHQHGYSTRVGEWSSESSARP
jgi:uncharacterized protein YbjQ (UPF0145 family)